MAPVFRPHIALPACLSKVRVLAMAIALVLLFAALVSPWGLVKSHGSAAVSALHHGEAWDWEGAHGHSHEDDDLTFTGGHAHHAGDHSHDHAQVVPLGLPGLSGATDLWQDRPLHAGPWPSLDGLERPPRA